MPVGRTLTELRDHLDSLGACMASIVWSRGKSAASAWSDCDRVSWMLWWAARTPINSAEEVVRFACWLAKPAPTARISQLEKLGDTELRDVVDCEVSIEKILSDAVVAASTLDIAALADFWEGIDQSISAVWKEAAQTAWAWAVFSKGMDPCTNARSVLRCPWKEADV
jgi:hypothetical protein